jgi:hypothetical protein
LDTIAKLTEDKGAEAQNHITIRAKGDALVILHNGAEIHSTVLEGAITNPHTIALVEAIAGALGAVTEVQSECSWGLVSKTEQQVEAARRVVKAEEELEEAEREQNRLVKEATERMAGIPPKPPNPRDSGLPFDRAATTPPEEPKDGFVWLDQSQEPHQPKTWDSDLKIWVPWSPPGFNYEPPNPREWWGELKLDAYNEGYYAGRLGAEEDDNPYNPSGHERDTTMDDEQYWAWGRGCRHGEEDAPCMEDGGQRLNFRGLSFVEIMAWGKRVLRRNT